MKLLKSRRVVFEDEARPAALLIEGEKIVQIFPPDSTPDSADIQCVDYGDLAIMPGLVDTHVHINEPGRTEWEGFATATAAAAKGGVTTLVDMPLNCKPTTTSAAALVAKLEAARGKISVDCGFYGGIVPDNFNDIEALIEQGVLGFKSFLIHSGISDFPMVTEAHMRRALPVLKKGGVPYLIHAELETPTPTPLPLRGGGDGGEGSANQRSYSTYLASRPRKWENDAVELVARLAGEANAHMHVVHLSSTDRLDLIESVRRRNIPLTLETCHHYLTFAAEDIPDGATEYKCAPPIRERENREKLWQALQCGTIDFAVSDHSPCTPDLKLPGEGDFLQAWGGIAGLQFSLPVFYTQARLRGFSLVDTARLLARAPADFVGLKNKGRIEVGASADFAIFDTEAEQVLTPELIAHRHQVTPYLGMRLKGVVRATWLRGKNIWDGKNLTAQTGQILLRK